jgi:hypothetical protein
MICALCNGSGNLLIFRLMEYWRYPACDGAGALVATVYLGFVLTAHFLHT